MSTTDKIINYGFVVIFTIVMTLTVIGHVRLALTNPDYNDSDVFYVW